MPFLTRYPKPSFIALVDGEWWVGNVDCGFRYVRWLGIRCVFDVNFFLIASASASDYFPEFIWVTLVPESVSPNLGVRIWCNVLKIWPMACHIRYDVRAIWHPSGRIFRILHHILEPEIGETRHWLLWMTSPRVLRHPLLLVLSVQNDIALSYISPT